jgi:hypothetical protein
MRRLLKMGDAGMTKQRWSCRHARSVDEHLAERAHQLHCEKDKRDSTGVNGRAQMVVRRAMSESDRSEGVDVGQRPEEGATAHGERQLEATS